MAEEEPKGEVKSFAKKQREKRISELTDENWRLRMALEVYVEEFRGAYLLYVAGHRVLRGCDPDTSEVPLKLFEEMMVPTGDTEE